MSSIRSRVAAAVLAVAVLLAGCGGSSTSDTPSNDSPPPSTPSPQPTPAPTPTSYLLTIAASGSGRVSSGPAGIECGNDCSQSYTDGTEVTLTATANSGYTFSGWTGACSGVSPSCKVTINAAINVGAGFVANIGRGATYYVATSGNDNNNGSSSAPWRTIAYGASRLASGDTLIVRAGEYFDLANFINTRHRPIASGTPAAFTTIRAETPFSVRILNTGSLDYWDAPVFLQGSVASLGQTVTDSYIHVDGFIFDIRNSLNPAYMGWIYGHHNKITRSIFRRVGNVDNYGGWVTLIGDYNLVEDAAGVGAARYGFITGGPSATSRNNIFRRVVGRIDYTNSTEPKATFSVYGNDGLVDEVRDHLFQNCIAIDGRRGPRPIADNDTYGGFYFPKNAMNATIQGSIVLNTEVGYAGYFVKELSGRNIKVEHSVAWDIWNTTSDVSGVRANGNVDTAALIFDHMTIGRSGVNPMYGYTNWDHAPTKQLTNTFFYNNTGIRIGTNQGWTSETNNAFAPAAQAEGSHPVTTGLNLRYVVRPEPGSGLIAAGSGGSDIGATILYRYGASGTLWGEAGYDQLTTESLWPWPYEAQIKAVFAEPNDPPAGNTPSSNDTVRGFCATRARLDGVNPVTLTSYIWEYLGNPIPADIYR
ncbi:MAG: hypothetical protein HY308_19760 [Gammaproteobacteria bacterium]|nr:hypothetical protein [Gammaproteobacteria bacterium]